VAIEEPGAEDGEGRAGERVARTDPVTAVFSRRVRPGREAEFEDWAHGVIAAATRWPGHLGASVLHEPDSPWYHLVYKFTDRDRFRAWVESEERDHWLGQVERLTEDTEHELQETTGLETWFDLPGPAAAPRRPPPRWKMWMVSLAAVYPLVVLFQWVLVPPGRAPAPAGQGRAVPPGAAHAHDLRGHAPGHQGPATLAGSPPGRPVSRRGGVSRWSSAG
jgi:uncharacterized protein